MTRPLIIKSTPFFNFVSIKRNYLQNETTTWKSYNPAMQTWLFTDKAAKMRNERFTPPFLVKTAPFCYIRVESVGTRPKQPYLRAENVITSKIGQLTVYIQHVRHFVPNSRRAPIESYRHSNACVKENAHALIFCIGDGTWGCFPLIWRQGHSVSALTLMYMFCSAWKKGGPWAMARYNVREGWMVEELRREREASSLDIEELTHFLSGNEVLTESRRRICKSLPNPPRSEYTFQLNNETCMKYWSVCRWSRGQRPSI